MPTWTERSLCRALYKGPLGNSHLVLTDSRSLSEDKELWTTGLGPSGLGSDKISLQPVPTLGLRPGACDFVQITVTLVFPRTSPVSETSDPRVSLAPQASEGAWGVRQGSRDGGCRTQRREVPEISTKAVSGQ